MTLNNKTESRVSWEIGNRQRSSPLSRPDSHFLALKTGQISACFHPATFPEARGRNAGAGQDPWYTELYVWLQLWQGLSAAEEGLRILQWFLAQLEIPGVCTAGPGLYYTAAAAVLLLSCSSCPEKPRSTAEAVNFVSFSLCGKCDCQCLQQDPSCVCPCYNSTISALGHEGTQERTPCQTKGKALLVCSQGHWAGSGVGAWGNTCTCKNRGWQNGHRYPLKRQGKVGW